MKNWEKDFTKVVSQLYSQPVIPYVDGAQDNTVFPKYKINFICQNKNNRHYTKKYHTELDQKLSNMMAQKSSNSDDSSTFLRFYTFFISPLISNDIL